MRKTVKFADTWGNTYDLVFSHNYYSHGNGDALTAYIVENGTITEPFDTFTVNIEGAPLAENEVCVDTNNITGADKFLIKSGFAKRTGKVAFSGFCSYPIVKLDWEALAPYLTD